MNIFGRMMERSKTDSQSELQKNNRQKTDLNTILTPMPISNSDTRLAPHTESGARNTTPVFERSEAIAGSNMESRSAPIQASCAKTMGMNDKSIENNFESEDFTLFGDRPEWDEIQGFLKSIQDTSTLQDHPAKESALPETVRDTRLGNIPSQTPERTAQHMAPSETVKGSSQTVNRSSMSRLSESRPMAAPSAAPLSQPRNEAAVKPTQNLETAVQETQQIRERVQSHTLASKTEVAKAQDYVETLSQYSRRALEQSRQTDVRLRGLSGVLGQIELKLAKYGQMESHLATTLVSNQTLRNALEKRTHEVQALELKIKSLEPQYAASRKSLELARQDLATQRDVLISQKEKLNKFNKLLSRAATRVAETDSQYGGLVQAYKLLQTECRTQATEISDKVREFVALKKETEVLQSKLELRTTDYEEMAQTLTSLKSEYADVKRRLAESTTAFENSGYEFRSQLKLLKNQLVRRVEENRLLKIQVQNLKMQSEEEGGLSAHREREIKEIKEALEAERARVRVAEARSVDKAHLADMNSRALERAKLEYEVLNEKYATALSDVEMLRSMALTQNEKLARYASLSGSIDPRSTVVPVSKLSAIQDRNAQNIPEAGAFDPGFIESPQSQLS